MGKARRTRRKTAATGDAPKPRRTRRSTKAAPADTAPPPAATGRAPTERMLAFARDVAHRKRMPLPPEVEQDFTACRRFLDEHGGRTATPSAVTPAKAGFPGTARGRKQARASGFPLSQE